ncbi:MAG: pyrroline-5-carboxylate reductase [Pseudomonadota bacterium]|nr:pyrroline-5-carboxylate reductase [Pseudomonadota bacterium]
MDYKNSKIAFIGGGNMAQAIIRGLISAAHSPKYIHVSDPDIKKIKTLQKINNSMLVTESNHKAVKEADIIVIAVKPQIIYEVLKELSKSLNFDKQLLISIAAGSTLNSLKECLSEKAKLVRAMPNQPALVGKGMCGLFATSNVKKDSCNLASYVMGSVGKVIWVNNEDQMNPLTALSGSGPAYFYLLMEILEEIAKEFGFDSQTARELSLQTALGASDLASNSNESLTALKKKVTSPGGTTEAALLELEAAGIRDIFRKALKVASNRSIELGQSK